MSSMNPHPFFQQKQYYGKILGGFFGYLLGGPAGALFGVFVGNFFDKGLVQHFQRPYWEVYAQRHVPQHALFITTTFMVLGYLAKIEGVVSPKAIDYAKQLMQSLRLTHSQIESAKEAFNIGKSPAFQREQTLLTFRKTFQANHTLIMTFLTIQYQLVQQVGWSAKKQKALDQLFEELGYAPLAQQFRFYENHFHGHQHTHQRSTHQGSRQVPPTHLELSNAYQILGLSSQADHATVKRAYRRLIGKHHPDKLIAQRKSAAEIKVANEQTQQIRRAYEIICATQGWA